MNRCNSAIRRINLFFSFFAFPSRSSLLRGELPIELQKPVAIPFGIAADQTAAAARKPSSVPVTIFPKRVRPFLWDARCRTPQATYPRIRSVAPGQGLSAYLVLLPVGFALPSESPRTRCALTAPFHPYRCSRQCSRQKSENPLSAYCLLHNCLLTRRYLFCCTFRRIAPP